MSSYVNVFGGGVVQPSFSFYSAINLNQNIALAWSTDFGNNPNVVSSIMDISPNANGLSVTMPDARNVSVGFSFSINNKTLFSFTLLANDGSTPISVVNADTFNEFYLTDNSTQNGSWSMIPSLGSPSVNSIGLITTGTASSNLSVSSDTTNPITLSGTFSIDLTGELASIVSLGAFSGLATRSSDGVWSTAQIAGTTNQISVANGSGVDGSPTISLAPNIGGINSISLVGGNLNIGVTPNTISATNVNGGVTISSIGSGSVGLSATGTGNVFLTTVSGFIGANCDLLLTDESGVLFGDSTNKTVQIVAPPTVPVSYTLALPGGIPSANQCLGVSSVVGPVVQADWLNISNVTPVTTPNTLAYFTSTSGGMASTAITTTGNDGFGNPVGITIGSIGELIVGNVKVTGNKIETLSGNLLISPASPDDVVINSDVQIQTGSQISLYNASNTFSYGFRASTAMSGSFSSFLPPNNGSVGGILSTNGANPATLVWSNALINLTSANFGPNNIKIVPNSIVTDGVNDLTIGTNNLIAISIDGSTQEISFNDNFSLKNGSQQLYYNPANTFSYGISSGVGLSANYNITLPLNNGSAGGLLSTNGSNPGATSWVNALTNLTSASFGTNNITILPSSINTTGATALTLGTNSTTAISIDASQNVTISSGTLTLNSNALLRNNSGTRYFNATNTFYYGIVSPGALAATYILNLPLNNGTAGGLLSTDGSNPANSTWTNALTNLASASFGSNNIAILPSSINTTGTTALTLGTNNTTAITISTAQLVTTASNLVVTGRIASSPGVGSSSQAITLGTPFQNTSGFDIMLNVYVRVVAAATTFTFSVSPTSITTGNTFATAAAQIVTIPLYVPAGYFAYVQATGGTPTFLLAQSIPV